MTLVCVRCVRLATGNTQASCADPSIVRIMLENGALERLIGYLSTAHLDHPKTHSTPQERFATECGEREYAEQAIDDQDPSLLLISRLLFQFSQDRYCRLESLHGCYFCCAMMLVRTLSIQRLAGTWVCWKGFLYNHTLQLCP